MPETPLEGSTLDRRSGRASARWVREAFSGAGPASPVPGKVLSDGSRKLPKGTGRADYDISSGRVARRRGGCGPRGVRRCRQGGDGGLDKRAVSEPDLVEHQL